MYEIQENHLPYTKTLKNMVIHLETTNQLAQDFVSSTKYYSRDVVLSILNFR